MKNDCVTNTPPAIKSSATVVLPGVALVANRRASHSAHPGTERGTLKPAPRLVADDSSCHTTKNRASRGTLRGIRSCWNTAAGNQDDR
jgi:hypothetical protein